MGSPFVLNKFPGSSTDMKINIDLSTSDATEQHSHEQMGEQLSSSASVS